MAGYGDDTSYGTWLTENGLPAPADGVAVAVLRQRGSTYLDGLYGPKFSGQPTDGFAQDRAWPRVGAEAHCQPIPSDLVPLAIVHASYFAAHQEQTQPGSLSVAATAAGAVKRRKIDVVEIEFFEGSGDVAGDATVRLSVVEGLVAPFLTQPIPAIFVV